MSRALLVGLRSLDVHLDTRWFEPLADCVEDLAQVSPIALVLGDEPVDILFGFYSVRSHENVRQAGIVAEIVSSLAPTPPGLVLVACGQVADSKIEDPDIRELFSGVTPVPHFPEVVRATRVDSASTQIRVVLERRLRLFGLTQHATDVGDGTREDIRGDLKHEHTFVRGIF